MKKIMFLTMMMVIALAVGSAYADESATWALTQSGNEPNNGITVFSVGPADFDSLTVGAGEMIGSYAEGSAAGGWREEEALMEPYNGVTIFSAGAADFDTVPLAGAMSGYYEESSGAGGLREEVSEVEPHNGITIFTTGPAVYDSIPAGTVW
jgi:hypothetical protein